MLHDVSRTPGRDNPSPNTHDTLAAQIRPAHGTNAVNYFTGASDRAIVAGALNGQQTIVKTLELTTNPLSADGPGAGAFNQIVLNGAFAPHGLDFVPALMGFYGTSATIFGQLPSTNYIAVGNTQALWFVIETRADPTYVFVDFRIMQYGGTDSTSFAPLDVKLYLLQQTAN